MQLKAELILTLGTFQSKKGALWSREPLSVPSFSSIIKFRISGKGKNFFGDGIAIWFVQQSFYEEGELHGFQEQFIGPYIPCILRLYVLEILCVPCV